MLVYDSCKMYDVPISDHQMLGFDAYFLDDFISDGNFLNDHHTRSSDKPRHR